MQCRFRIFIYIVTLHVASLYSHDVIQVHAFAAKSDHVMKEMHLFCHI